PNIGVSLRNKHKTALPSLRGTFPLTRSPYDGCANVAIRAAREKFDAWARIRTWEPLREGILSPSPLTRLGYPRAARETPGAVKPFLVQPSRAPVSQRLIPSRTVPKGRPRWRNTSLKPFSKRWRVASTPIPNGPEEPRPLRRKSS